MELQDSMEREGAAEAGSAARAAVGATLREAREGMGMSVEEVAGRLKFAPRQVAALEAGDFSQLPEMAFVRGFVRSYARLLQLDEKTLLDALPGAPAAAAVQVRAGGNEVPRQGAERMRQNLFWLGAAVVVVVLGIIAWKYDAGERKPAETGTAVETAQTGTAPAAPAGQSAEMQPPAQPAGTSAAGAAAQSGEAGAAAASAPQVTHAAATPQAPMPEHAPRAAGAAPATAAHNGEKKPAHPAMHGAVAKASGVPAVAPMARVKPGVEQQAASGVAAGAPSRTVHLEFTEDSWVEVRDGTGKILLSMLGKQGTSRNASGPAPLSVVVGNAKGVKLVYKGQPVTLQPVAGSEVARLKLE